MNSNNYTQCKLRSNGSLEHTAWIPSQYAKIGKIIRLKDMPHIWEVVEVYATRTLDEVRARERDHLNQRKASDV